MIDQSFEQRVAAGVAAYADEAPTDVDALLLARLVSARSRRIGPIWFGNVSTGRGLVVAVALLALLVTMLTGAFVAGGYLRDRPLDGIVGQRALVEPFVGLPPERAAPSSPETGELVLSFGGRVRALGLDFHRMWVYADGRLIWKSGLEGSSEGWRSRFGATEPTTAVIEQHLTPEGVELLRSAVLAAGLHDRRPLGPAEDPTDWGRPGVLWGGLVLRDGGRLVQAEWRDPALPGLLAVPASWLPPSAWEDPRIGAYVPSRYAVCLDQALPAGVTGLAPTDVWDLLPEPTRYLIRSRALEDPAPDWNERDARCLYQVSTEDVRAIAAAFDEAGFQWASPDVLSYEFPIGHEFPGVVQLLVITPNGEVVCYCG